MQSHVQLRGVTHDVIVGEDMAFLVDDEARSLTFLRHRPVEEIVSHGLGGDVDHGRNDPVIDLDVVLLVGIQLLRASGFAKFNVSRPRDDLGHGVRALMVSGEPVKCAGDNDAKKERS